MRRRKVLSDECQDSAFKYATTTSYAISSALYILIRRIEFEESFRYGRVLSRICNIF